MSFQQDESLSLTHRSVGCCTTSKSVPRSNKRHLRTAAPPKVVKTHEELMRRYQEQVDGTALIIFPISFLLFNIGYWCHYLLNVWWPDKLKLGHCSSRQSSQGCRRWHIIKTYKTVHDCRLQTQAFDFAFGKPLKTRFINCTSKSRATQWKANKLDL